MGPNRMETGNVTPSKKVTPFNSIRISRRGLLEGAASVAGAGILKTITPDIAIAQAAPVASPRLLQPADSPNSRVPNYDILATKDLLETAEKSQTTVKNTLTETGLEKMVNRVAIYPAHKIVLDNTSWRYGKKFEEPRGHGGYIYVNPDGLSLMVIGSQPDQKEVRKNTLHESSHMLDPRFNGIDYLIGDFRNEIDNRRKKFEDSYTTLVGQGKYVDLYDRDILDGGSIKVGEMAWPTFAKAMGLSEKDPQTFSASQLKEAFNKPNLPKAYRAILEDFMDLIKNDPTGVSASISDYFNSSMLGRSITKLYWQGKDIFSPFSPSQRKELGAVLKRFKESAELEAWAVLGQQAFDNPQVTRLLHPEFFGAFSFIYERVSGKTLENAVPQPAPSDLSEALKNKWALTSFDGRNIFKKYLVEARSATSGKDAASKIEDVREQVSSDLKNLAFYDRQNIAEGFEIYLKDPQELAGIIDELQLT